jgi:hypothetical protein
MITRNDVITASGKFPARANSPELIPAIISNIDDLIVHVNALLKELGFESRKVSSGFRPSDVNGKISNAAKKSAHMTGMAVDIEDADGKLAQGIMYDTRILGRNFLYMESPQHTKGWVHLSTRAPLSGNRVFIP